MMRILSRIFAGMVVVLYLHSLITGDNRLIMTYIPLLLGLMFVATGITETQDKRKVHATISFLLGGILLFFSVYEIFS